MHVCDIHGWQNMHDFFFHISKHVNMIFIYFEIKGSVKFVSKKSPQERNRCTWTVECSGKCCPLSLVHLYLLGRYFFKAGISFVFLLIEKKSFKFRQQNTYPRSGKQKPTLTTLVVPKSRHRPKLIERPHAWYRKRPLDNAAADRKSVV